MTHLRSKAEVIQTRTASQKKIMSKIIVLHAMRVFTRKWRPEGQLDLWIFSPHWMWVVTEKCDRTTGCQLTVAAPVQHGSLLASPCEPSFREATSPIGSPPLTWESYKLQGWGHSGIEAICFNKSIGVWDWELGKGFLCLFCCWGDYPGLINARHALSVSHTGLHFRVANPEPHLITLEVHYETTKSVAQKRRMCWF